MSAVIISAHNNTLHYTAMSPAGTTIPSDVATLDPHIYTWHRVRCWWYATTTIWPTQTQSTLHRFHSRTFGPKILRDVKNIINVSEICVVFWWLLVRHMTSSALKCLDLFWSWPWKEKSCKSLLDVVQINIFHFFHSYYPAYLIFWYSKNIPKVNNYIICQFSFHLYLYI